MTLFWNNSKSHSKYDCFFKMHFYFKWPFFAARLEMAWKRQVEKKIVVSLQISFLQLGRLSTKYTIYMLKIRSLSDFLLFNIHRDSYNQEGKS